MSEITKLFWSLLNNKKTLFISFQSNNNYLCIQELIGSSKIAILTLGGKWEKFRLFKSVEEIDQ